MSEPLIVPCWVYRCTRKDETYVYLSEEDAGASLLPAPVAEALGPLELVMKLELHAQRHLARADVNKVMSELRQKGFYLQLPPPRPGSSLRH